MDFDAHRHYPYISDSNKKPYKFSLFSEFLVKYVGFQKVGKVIVRRSCFNKSKFITLGPELGNIVRMLIWNMFWVLPLAKFVIPYCNIYWIYFLTFAYCFVFVIGFFTAISDPGLMVVKNKINYTDKNGEYFDLYGVNPNSD